jgi:hypothetical protein
MGSVYLDVGRGAQVLITNYNNSQSKVEEAQVVLTEKQRWGKL